MLSRYKPYREFLQEITKAEEGVPLGKYDMPEGTYARLSALYEEIVEAFELFNFLTTDEYLILISALPRWFVQGC